MATAGDYIGLVCFPDSEITAGAYVLGLKEPVGDRTNTGQELQSRFFAQPVIRLMIPFRPLGLAWCSVWHYDALRFSVSWQSHWHKVRIAIQVRSRSLGDPEERNSWYAAELQRK
jgi:hypothetical protein